MTHAITLYENLRTTTYVPFYLAIVDGDWEKLGLSVDTQLSPATSETAQALLEGRADVSWGGPMRVMLHHDRDPDCPLVCFGQVVGRDPFILVGRTPKRQFKFADLIGRRVAVASEVPTPWMTFQDDLQRAGIDPGAIDRAPDATMAENVVRLKNGEVDVIQVFQPYAELAVCGGFGHVWHRFSIRGDIGFTTFYTRRAFIADNRDVCVKLVQGAMQASKRLHRQSARKTAERIAPFFPDLEIDTLVNIISGYRKANLWARDPALPATAIVRLKAALLSGGLISRDIPYDHIVDDSIAEDVGGF
ncbi:MAG: ABC transporter substrate-binding protein [Hyphomicrobiaceae bacterium]